MGPVRVDLRRYEIEQEIKTKERAIEKLSKEFANDAIKRYAVSRRSLARPLTRQR